MFSNLDNSLWAQYDLEQITKDDIFLPQDKIEVLQEIIVLLVTLSDIETSTTHSYIKPLDGHEKIYKFKQVGEARNIIYFIGKYGACPAAITNGFKLCDSTDTISMMVDQCFPNLGAIISVGVACGIKEKVQMYDVLVSSTIINYDKAVDGDRGYLPKGEQINVLPQLLNLFTPPVQWPDDINKKLLNNIGEEMPTVKSGIILSGPYHGNDQIMKIRNLDHDAIGIAMDEIHLFAANQEIPGSTIIVKAVCDFGDGKNDKVHQPIAALLAADLVHKCLHDPQAPKVLKGLLI